MPAGAASPSPGGNDQVLPFLLEVPDLRGRLLRTGPALDRVLARHAYPQPVAVLLGELLTLAGLLSSLVKHGGAFTLQIKGDGPVRLMVVDVSPEGRLRGYAQFDAAAVQALSDPMAEDGRLAALVGQGVLACTIDPGGKARRYQGIVELTGPTLAESFCHYFRQSEQLRTGIQVAVSRCDDGWRAGGLLLQELPDSERAKARLGNAEEDDWRRALVLMASCTRSELLDPVLSANDLLFRLFHEERVRVFQPKALAFGCSCSRERITAALRAMPSADLVALRQDREIEISCQFCEAVYRFDETAIDAVMAAAGA